VSNFVFNRIATYVGLLNLARLLLNCDVKW
jgi:hypothetical protein